MEAEHTYSFSPKELTLIDTALTYYLCALEDIRSKPLDYNAKFRVSSELDWLSTTIGYLQKKVQDHLRKDA